MCLFGDATQILAKLFILNTIENNHRVPSLLQMAVTLAFSSSMASDSELNLMMTPWTIEDLSLP